MGRTLRTLACLAAAIVLAAPASGHGRQGDAAKQVSSDDYDELLARYLDAARQAPPAPSGDADLFLNALMLDLRARRVNDVVTVRVVENVVASGTADASVAKSADASASVPIVAGAGPLNLFAMGRDSRFKGAGTTTRAGTLMATVSARVREVLPGGDLVLEGVHEIDINGDRQIVVLTGVARVADIAPDNSVPSTSLAQLRIRYFGRGLMKDSLTPGWLIRAFNWIF
ncbi:MAG: flagellar basal body L-ring protein FlgH [Acidobacteria bacterium]|nr:flagellar basal body L-ring protein FlgH [Acidobacteriota bacterium]